MYKKGLRSIPRTIRREVARVLDTSMTIVKTEVARANKNGLACMCENPFPFPLDEVDPALAEEIRKALSEIEGLPSYWLLTPFIDPSTPYIVFECKLKYDVEQEVSDSIASIHLIFPSVSQYYGIY